MRIIRKDHERTGRENKKTRMPNFRLYVENIEIGENCGRAEKLKLLARSKEQ